MSLRLAPLAAAALALTSFAAPLSAQTTTVPIDPRVAFLHVNSDNALNAPAISLASLGAAPGKCLRLSRLGNFDNGPGGDTFTSMIGVFSSSSVLLAGSNLHRVPGAIDAGIDVLTSNTYFGNQVTDIDEDFSISTTGVDDIVIKVPAGAAFLFVCPSDQLFQDNSDPNGNYALQVTVVGCWTNLGHGLAGAGGTPLLTGTGTLIGGEPITLDLTGAKANSSAALIVGFGVANAPLKGGTLVPTPDLIITGLPTGPAGALSLPAAWPAGLPSGFSLYFQEWIADASGPAGFAATNGLQATTP